MTKKHQMCMKVCEVTLHRYMEYVYKHFTTQSSWRANAVITQEGNFLHPVRWDSLSDLAGWGRIREYEVCCCSTQQFCTF